MTDDVGTDIAVAASQMLEDPAVREFAGRIPGEPAAETGGLIADRIRFRRFKSWIKMAKGARELLDEAGIEPHQVPATVAIPLIESGSLETDESLQEKWAALLANAAANPESVPASYPRSDHRAGLAASGRRAR